MRNNVFTFEPDKPEIIALKYKTGKPCSTGNYTYTLANGLVAFFPPEADREIQALHPDPGQKIQITKRRVEGKGFSWEVERVPGAQMAVQEEKRPVPASSIDSNHITSSSWNSVSGLRQALFAVIDDASEAEKYAAGKGLSIRFSGEDIRTMANTQVIQGGIR
jgi:hypothetical protein